MILCNNWYPARQTKKCMQAQFLGLDYISFDTFSGGNLLWSITVYTSIPKLSNLDLMFWSQVGLNFLQPVYTFYMPHVCKCNCKATRMVICGICLYANCHPVQHGLAVAWPQAAHVKRTGLVLFRVVSGIVAADHIADNSQHVLINAEMGSCPIKK